MEGVGVAGAAGVTLMDCDLVAGAEVLTPTEVEARVEATADAAAKVMKATSGSSATCLFTGTSNLSGLVSECVWIWAG